MYKTSRYEYSSSGGDAPKTYESVEPANTSQLDDLLDDLKKSPKYSADKGKSKQTYPNIHAIYLFCSIFYLAKDAGIDPGLL